MRAPLLLPCAARAPIVLACLLLCPTTASAEPYDLDLELHGYYRMRAVSINNLANEDRPTAYYHDDASGKDLPQRYKRMTWNNYLLHKVRLEPVIKVGELVKLQMTVDALDNVVWGDNDAMATSPLFAAGGTSTDYRGGQPDVISLRRVWLDIDLKLGRLRVGRMASHWGMGLLSHGGGTFGGPEGYQPRDFGDYRFGSIYDRVLFATRPISVFKHLAGYDDTSSPIIFAYAYDKLVEDPLELDQPRAYYRPIGESGFLSSGEDDVQEHVFVLLYRQPELELFAETDSISAGLYVVIRTQSASRKEEVKDQNGDKLYTQYSGEGSLIHIWDFWAKVRLGPLDFETELLTIQGRTDGGVPIGKGKLLKKDAAIYAGALRLGWLTDSLDGVFELGFSSGDANLSDDTFSQRASNPDYGVGLLLFREVLRERTARVLGRALSPGLQSNGGVINATYLFPRARYRPLPWLEGILGVLVAWRNEPTLNLYSDKDGSFLGAEVDLAIKARWEEAHLSFALETGYLFFGDALKFMRRDDASGTFSPGDITGAWTLQGRLAFAF
jgi:hypothetical protein